MRAHDAAMGKVKLKTTPSAFGVAAFLKEIPDDEQRADAQRLAKIFRAATGKRAKMWGTSIVGYGKYAYKYASGREGEFLRTGFSPRKGTLVVYILPGYSEFSPILANLGKHKKGKCCLYVKRLSDVDTSVLEELVLAGWKEMEGRYGPA